MTFIPYDYEAAYNKSLEDMHEFFVEQMFKQGKKVVYALKEIRAGDQFEVEIYPQFKKMDEVPPECRSIKKDNDKAQRNLNDKNARKYVERLINENFTDMDLWLTFTYDNEHLPPDGDPTGELSEKEKGYPERKICLCDCLQSDRGNPVASSHCHGWRHGHGCG